MYASKHVLTLLMLAVESLTIELSFDAIPILALSAIISPKLINDFSPTDKALSPQFLRLKLPNNYLQIDDYELKAIELLGINKDWLIDISIDNSFCTH